MASRRMLPHTVHLFNYTGEVNDEAVYQESVVVNCYCDWSEGVVNKHGPGDTAKLYIFDLTSKIKSTNGVSRTFLAPEQFASAATKTAYFTLSGSGKDYFTIDNGEKFVIQSYAHKRSGSRRCWHYEVTAK